jgi:hypothetical protein
VTAHTADITTVKLLLNAAISENAQWMTADIKDFYLGTPLDRPEYMRIYWDRIPEEMRQRYNLAAFRERNHVYVRISNTLYGLPQAGALSQ